MPYELRTATHDDIPALRTFFLEAYGRSTIFQSEDFLLWYFGRELGRAGTLSSAVAVTEGGAIAAHYGWLPQRLLLADGTDLSLAWGVSAFTLPEHREKGLGQKLLTYVPADVFGVIGFTPKTASFYETIGFHLFKKKRFKRFVLPLSRDLLEVTDLIETTAKVESLLARIPSENVPLQADTGLVWRLGLADMERFDLPTAGGVARTSRDREYLRWRFFENPALTYEILGVIAGDRLKAYIVQRRELLRPTPYFATRIVDANGEAEVLRSVVAYSVEQAIGRRDTFVDFEVFGNVYDAVFEDLGFARLLEDETALLPRVTDPVEPRPNHEYVGLFSSTRMDLIVSLSDDDAVFTRADSDRDRAARISR